MEDMIILDGFAKLKPEQFTEFASYLKEDEQINIFFTNESVSKDARVLSCPLTELVDTLFSDTVRDYCVNSNDEILVQCEKAVIRTSGGDIKWWFENNRRMNKIRAAIGSNNSEQEQKPVKQSTSKPSYDKNAKFSVAIADLTEEGLVHVDFTQGTKAECLQWLNKAIVQHTDLSGSSTIVFNLHFKEEDVDNIDAWLTLEELVADKKVVLQ